MASFIHTVLNHRHGGRKYSSSDGNVHAVAGDDFASVQTTSVCIGQRLGFANQEFGAELHMNA
jgi:hypothetical protein